MQEDTAATIAALIAVLGAVLERKGVMPIEEFSDFLRSCDREGFPETTRAIFRAQATALPNALKRDPLVLSVIPGGKTDPS